MKKATQLTHISRPKIGAGGPVNPGIVRASTLLFDKAEDLYSGKVRSYGRHGSALHDQLADAFCALENGKGCSLTASGLAANTLSILANVKAGDHILVSDSCYGPVRHFCDRFLSKFGVTTEYYPPNIEEGIAGGIETLFKPNTSLILLESPGSLSMDIQDIPAICERARKHKITTVVDNTWSAGLVLSPLDLGADICVHAATKYFSGHSDVLFGAVISRTAAMAKKVHAARTAMGEATSPDDAYQILRGFRTVHTRFTAQAGTALRLAKWLKTHDKVVKVLHPALPGAPGHKIWKRDFTGCACLFSFVLKPCTNAQQLAFLDRLKLFAKGFSFGGYESLIIHCDPQLRRDFPLNLDGPLIRIACGLEDADDLIADLDAGLSKLKLK